MLDIYDDKELDVIKDKELPDFVKQSKIKSKSEYDRFAVKIAKNNEVEFKFPIDDKASTWLSEQYYENTKDNLSKEARKVIGNNIAKACERFDIEHNIEQDEVEKDIVKESNLFNETTINSNGDGTFLLPSKEKYPVKNEEQVKEAVGYFNEYQQDFNLKEKREYSENLIKEAEKNDVKIENEDVLKFGSKSDKINDSFEMGMKARKELLRGDEKSQETINTLIEKKSEIPPNVLVELVEEFDKQAGITSKWGTVIPEPDLTVKAVQNDLNKIAQSMTYKGKNITPDEIENISRDKLKKYFNENQIEDLMESPQDVFYALPDPHKEIIIDLINGNS